MKNNMSKKLNIILVGMFCSASVMAQTDTLTAHRDNMAVDFGRKVNITDGAGTLFYAIMTL